ncbi:MAG: hydrogenase formation protein HypD [Candidatus Omnitrophica bacterium]|nr:hydrogenase formation protein HypD [Candidatus Omnitrophota bacterium]
MKFVDEFRNAKDVHTLSEAIKAKVTRPWKIMEICGGQTHAIVKFGLDTLLPQEVSLIHGPGCPVCVTPLESIDRAIAVAMEKDVIFCSFGDMVRVPGSSRDLLTAKAEGADVRIVYAPLDALKIAVDNPSKRVVFFSVGFETTAPATAMAVYQAREAGVRNFFLLAAHVLVPPAMRLILGSADNRIQGFLAAGHVCAVMGCTPYETIAREFNVPVVVTGFEPLDILRGIYLCVCQLEAGTCNVENEYARAVRLDGNILAQQMMAKVFKVIDRPWRGIGVIKQSGLGLADVYKDFDAERAFDVGGITAEESPACISGVVLQGIKRPHECPAFGLACTPQHPLGAPMVSSEGACAAYYQYRRGATV